MGWVTTCVVAWCMGVASLCQAQRFDQVCTSKSAPALTVRGTQFIVNGQPQFRVLASYFDAMRASQATLEGDFAFLKSKGIGGVRIFPLWIRDVGTATGQKPEATLLDSDGKVRSDERWNHFVKVLSTAAACGFIVDVTFNRDMLNIVSPFSVAEYRGDPMQTRCAGGSGQSAGGLSEIACRLKGPAFAHVLFDLQNERNAGNAGMQLSMDEVVAIRDAIKKVDPDRLLMISHGGGATTDALGAVRSARLDVVAFHEEQQENWFKRTSQNVKALQAAGRPVYIQETARATPTGQRFRGVSCVKTTPDDNPLLQAVVEAKKAGAAAWTFHTDAGFRLDSESFQGQIRACQREAEFLDRLNQVIR